MRRGDLVTVAATGDYGKPRPAVIVQTDAFPESHASVVVCQLTSELVDAPDFRVSVDPTPEDNAKRPPALATGEAGREDWFRSRIPEILALVSRQLAFNESVSGRTSSTRSYVTFGVMRPRSPRSRRTRP